MIRSGSLFASQYSTSLFTHGESAASVDRSSTNQPDWSRASVIEDHKCGLALRDDSSTEDPKCSALPPRFGEPLQSGLQTRR